MTTKLIRTLCCATAFTAATLGHGNAIAQHERTPEKAQADWEKHCSYANLFGNERGPEHCLQESLGQGLTISVKFHDALFPFLGVTPSGEDSYVELYQKWRALPQDGLMDAKTIETYAEKCGVFISAVIHNPNAILNDIDATNSTLEISKFCLHAAIYLSEKYKIPVDLSDGPRVFYNLTQANRVIYPYRDTTDMAHYLSRRDSSEHPSHKP